jgi:hypothetical protein
MGQREAAAHSSPSWGATLSKPGLCNPVQLQGLCCGQWPCPSPPPASLQLSSSRDQLSPAASRMWLPGISVPSQPKEAPCQRQGATHSRVHGNSRHQENSRAAPGEPEQEGSGSHPSQASVRLSLPASLLSTRDHVVITKDSSGLPARNAVAATPTLPLSEGEDQGTGSQLVLPSTSPHPAPASPDRLAGLLPW